MENRPRPRTSSGGKPWLQPGRRFLLLGLLLLWPAMVGGAPRGAAAAATEAVVSVVSLNEQGEPWHQGLGVVVDKQGRLLTSAALLARGRGAIVKTAAGEKFLVRRVLSWDFFQDLALAQVEAEALPAAALGAPRGVKPQEQVWVGVGHSPPALKEARIAGVMPFSPRLTLLRLEPGDLKADLGAPVFNGKGELVGMLHAFAGDGEKSRGFQFFLARDRSHLPAAKEVREEEAPEWPEKVEDAPDFRASRVFWEGVAASLRQDWKGAREKFSAALQLPGPLPEALYGRGVARYHLRDYEAAAQDLEQASRALPGYARAFLWLGKSREGQGKQDAALEAYEKAAAADPGLSEAWFQWGTARYRQGDLARAQEYLEKAGDDFPQAAQRWWYLGIIYQSRERGVEAAAAFKRATRLDPQFFPAYLEGGRAAQGLGQAGEAVALLQEAVRLKPRHPAARYYLALAYLSAWKPAAAWEQYFVLQDLAPDLAASLATLLEAH